MTTKVGLTYEATLNASGWHIYRVSFHPKTEIRPGDVVRVCIASFGFGPVAERHAINAAERLINGELA